ncbi:MAG: sugar phosphate isomerase/epimerase [Candidatus Omnitrophota bacterium]
MLSLSTAWNAILHDQAQNILKDIKAMGIFNVELGFNLSREMIEVIKEFKKKNLINISSVHNFCPVPDGYVRNEFGPDYFSLASPDEKERSLAIELTKQTIITAKEIQANAVIIHAGRVQMQQKTKQLIHLYEQGKKNTPEYKEFLKQMQLERDAKKKVYLESALLSLEELISFAKTFQINVCVENRYYFREIPCFEELKLIFEHFGNCDNLFYWHDVGHAQVNENLGFANHLDFLNTYSNRLLGIHLHDVIGAQDHKVPGTGNFEFNRLQPYLKKHTIRVLEVHQPATQSEVLTGISFLKKMGICD